MTFKVSPRESLSRCETYDNKFRTYAEEPRLREARRLEGSRDVHETDSARLERMMMERLSKGIFRQEGVPVQFIKKVGKFIFVATLFPPYLVAYVIPKWVFQYALPFVADVGAQFLTKLAAGFASVSAWVLQVSGTVLERFNFSFLKKLKMPKRTLKASQDFLKHTFSKIGAFLSSRFKKMKAPLERLASKAACQVAHRLASMQKKAARIFERLKAWLLSRLPKMSFSIRIPFPRKLFGRCLQFLGTFPNMFSTWKRLAQNALEKAFWVVKSLRHLKKVPIALGYFLWDILKMNYQSWVAPCVRWLHPIWQAAIRTGQRLGRRFRRGASYLQKGVHGVISFADKIQERFLTLKNGLKSFFVFWGSKPFRIYEKGAAALLRLGDRIGTLWTMAAQGFSKAVDFGKRGTLSVVHYLAKLPRRGFYFLNRCGELILRTLSRLAGKIVLGLIWIKVFTRLGFRYFKSLI